MTLKIEPSTQACGARITGVDLSQPLDDATVAEIRAAWLAHHVICFPDQHLTDDDLERYSQYFGDFGYDPFIAPIEGRDHIIAVQRDADEQAPIFAENWHTDWSFLERPPAGTCLYGITIPPVGGDTYFANQHKALQDMPDDMRAKLEGKMAIHSAELAYAPEGSYGDADAASDRSMDIRPSDEAKQTWTHPIIRAHPETGELALFSTFGYIIGIEGMETEESWPLLMELQAWQGRDEFIYRHQWQKGDLVMWDNRSLLHRASGGYDGHARRLHRTTIAAWPGDLPAA
jgi:taurine dioxygenase